MVSGDPITLSTLQEFYLIVDFLLHSEDDIELFWTLLEPFRSGLGEREIGGGRQVVGGRRPVVGGGSQVVGGRRQEASGRRQVVGGRW